MPKNTVNEKKTSIGGQAVLEGVMMRGKSSEATAVRDADGIIRLESKRVAKKRNPFFRLPIIRGVVAFISSLVGGTKVLMRSAEVYGEGEPSKFEKWLSEKFNVNLMSVITTISLIIALGLAVFLFMFLPQVLRRVIEGWCGQGFTFNIWAKNFIEGGFKLLIFISYILLTSLLKDIRRTFMYHGAEHKTISCYEKGLPLTVENAKKCSRIHDRCGTTFLVFVMVISILTFALCEALLGGSVEKGWRILLKIALLPVVAGLSYELLKALSKTQSKLVLPLKLPGMLLQKITTREPDDDMLEVAITAFNTVIQMDADLSIKEQQFVVSKKLSVILDETKVALKNAGVLEECEAEWIVSIVLDIKRDDLKNDRIVTPKYIEIIQKITNERASGRPLWYCIGDTDFYGYKIKVDERVLIPRPETELLVENALKSINKNSKVLDLCTGSGAIAIAVKKESEANVTAVDISEDALTVAKENAKLNGTEIDFIKSDMFSALDGKVFDVIISNPPYIQSAVIDTLQREVKDFEPKLALDGGADGLEYYKIICDNALKYLTDGGILIMECGFDQASLIKNMLTEFKDVQIIKDYEGVDRIVKAVKNV